MKKSSKKISFVIIVLLVSAISLMALPVNALSAEKHGREISYSYEGMPAEKAEQIVNAMFGISDGLTIQRFASCSSHTIQTGTIKAVEHNYYSTAPRCKETISRVEYCTKSDCDYFKTVGSAGENRIGCH